jgi:hypothetical protein
LANDGAGLTRFRRQNREIHGILDGYLMEWDTGLSHVFFRYRPQPGNSMAHTH